MLLLDVDFPKLSSPRRVSARPSSTYESSSSRKTCITAKELEIETYTRYYKKAVCNYGACTHRINLNELSRFETVD